MKAVNSADGHDKELWRMFAELGWLAVPFAEEYGGFGGDVWVFVGPKCKVDSWCWIVSGAWD